MNWRHNFKHIDASPALQEYAEAHLGKLQKYLLKDSQWQVFYGKGKHHDCDVDVIVHEGNGHYKASAHGHDWYRVVDQVCLKLEKQFRKKKDKLQSHREGDLTFPYAAKKPA